MLKQDQQWLEVPIFSPRNPKRKVILVSILALRLLEHANEERTVRGLRMEFKEIRALATAIAAFDLEAKAKNTHSKMFVSVLLE